jgi:transposase
MQTNSQQHMESRGAGKPALIVKLGQDVHADSVMVCRQDGDTVPKPPRAMDYETLVDLCASLVASGATVYSCYEAGPCGYTLHRRLTAVGVINVVVVPRRWDPENRRVKTDRRDACQLCDALDRHLRGNPKVFSLVRVPTEEQEARRALCRQRGALAKEHQRCVVRGHGLLLLAGCHAPEGWWKPGAWEELAPKLAAELRARVAVWAEQARRLHRETLKWSREIVRFGATLPAPKGYGALTAGMVEAEVLDWGRFHNRGQVGSYTGLCPGEDSSGTRRRQGGVSKHGNPRLRHALVEAAWRLARWQPDYPPLRALHRASGSRARKRAIVAVARRLAVDLWRLRTGQCTAEKLGLKLR